MSRFKKKVSALWRRGQLDRDLDDELSFHLEAKAEECGDSMDARRRFGNPATLKEACREMWTFAAFESWWQDFHFALRTLAKTPGFALAAIVALALGIGADAAVFTIAKGAFSWNLGLDHIDGIVLVSVTDASHRQEFGESYPDFRDLRSQVKSLAGLAAYRLVSVNLSDKSNLPERYYCAEMSANGFSVSEQKPTLGRDFVADDERPGAPPVVMLSHHVWQDRYGKDTSIIGKTVRVNDVPTVVIGVMPPERRFPERNRSVDPTGTGYAA